MGDWIAHRRDVDWADADDAPIAPLLDQLDFTAGKTNWGYQLRFGLFEISATISTGRRSDARQAAALMRSPDVASDGRPRRRGRVARQRRRHGSPSSTA